MTEINKFLSNYGEILTIVALIAAAVFFAWNRLHTTRDRRHDRYAAEVADPNSHDDLLAELTQPNAAAYDTAIATLLTRTTDIFGPQTKFFQTYARCLQIALIYPLVAVLAGWLFGGAGTLGGVEFLPPETPFGKRLLTAVLLVGLGVYAFNFINISGFIEGKINRFLTRFTPEAGRCLCRCRCRCRCR